MTLEQIIKLAPLMTDIEEAITTVQRVAADPDVRAALATAEKVYAVLSAPAAAVPDTAASQNE